jgi:chromosome segregation ATPase
MESGTNGSIEDAGFYHSTKSDNGMENRKISEEEKMRRQIDKRMREQGKAREEYSTFDTHADPILILLRDLDDDSGNLSEEIGRIQAQLTRLESKVDNLLDTKSERAG